MKKPAAQAADADRQNPPIQQNRRNFWANDAIDFDVLQDLECSKPVEHSKFCDWKHHL